VLKRARIKDELKGELTEGVTRSPANNSVQRREMTGSDWWGLLVSEKKRNRGRGYRFGGGKWAAGSGTAQVGCCLPFPYFFDLFPFSFSFLFSYFFHRFCILNPNKVKPISKFL
jgi:hypothetical protein